MQSNNRTVTISKALSYLLRHGAVKENLPIDSNGYIVLEKLLQHNRLKSLRATPEDVRLVVANNDKQRFHLKEDPATGQLLICATQGHSLKHITPSEEVLVPVTTEAELPSKLVHGTNITNCVKILESGYLKKMNRNHVHLSPGITGRDQTVISGMRYSSTVYIHLKRNQALIDRLKLVKSLNNVYLSPVDIPIDYIERIEVRTKKGGDLLQQLKVLSEKHKIPIDVI